jgi:hypothetical protein
MFSLREGIEDIDPHKLIEMEGERGPFYVCRVGFHREAEYCFFYGDGKYQFFFYVKTDFVGVRRKLDIHDATVRRMLGASPSIESSDVRYIEHNIEKLFRERAFRSLSAIIPVEERPTQLRFTWKIG